MQRTWPGWAPLPLRIMVAIGFLYHGLPKFTAQGHEMFSGMLTGIGVPAPALMAWLVAFVEVGGAILILFGAFVFWAAIPLIGVMLTALATVHAPSGFNFMNITGMGPEGPVFGMPGYEVNLLYISILVSLMLSGAGAFSVDASRGQRVVTTRPAATT